MPERKNKDDFAEKAYAAAAAQMKSSGKMTAKPGKAGKAKKSSPSQPEAQVEEALSLPPLRGRNGGGQKAATPVDASVPFAGAAELPPAVEAPEMAAEVAPQAATPAPEVPVSPTPEQTTTDPKETTMASAPFNHDNVTQINEAMNSTVSTAISEMQNRAKSAYEKSSAAAGEATEFAKGNVEAMVESTKIFAAGLQDLGRSYAEEARAAYETMTADVKEMAAVKSPSELFQLQGKIARRNFDAMVATGSKNSEALMKLASEAFAPLSGRVNVAAEKIGKVS